MSTSLKQLLTIAAENNQTIILINQERACGMTGYGPKKTTPGGSAIKFYCSMRLDMNRTSWLEEGKTKVGQIVNIEAVKNKTYTPHKSTNIHLVFPRERNGFIFAGVDTIVDLVHLGIDDDIIEQIGAWYKWGEKKFHGLTKVYNHFIDNQEDYDMLYKQVNK